MSKVQQVRYLMPPGANDPIINKSTGQTTAIMYIGFSSPSLEIPAISDYLTRVVQPVLATVEGVASADVIGGQTFAMRVWLDPARMAARGISAAEVALAIRANNFQTAPGQQKGYFTVANISANTDLQSVDQFREMVVKAQEGALTRLKDIATISLDAQSFDAAVAMDGQNAVFIGVQPTPAGNPLTVVSGVRQKLASITNTLPPTLKMSVAYDASRFIQASIDDVIWTLAMAVGVVVVVIFLFLGSMRTVLIPIVTIPLSLIGAGTLMYAAGFSLNLLTLLAMVLAIGLVVDDAIVVVENVFRHIEEGKSPVQAALHRRARDRRTRHRHDHHARRGLCANRPARRRYRRPVQGVRLHACGRRDRLGHRRLDAIAGDVGGAAVAGGAPFAVRTKGHERLYRRGALV